MSPLFSRILTALLALGIAGAFGFGAAQVFRQAQQLWATFGAGFVLMLGLMTLLVLISLVRMPLSHASARRRHR